MVPTQPETQLVLVERSSSELTAADISQLLGSPARIVHIDGAHEKIDVMWDLSISEPQLALDGILVVDDFAQGYDIGVTEAVIQYLSSQVRSVVPFAIIGNKLFCARRARAPRFKEWLENFARTNEDYPETKRFRERAAHPGTADDRDRIGRIGNPGDSMRRANLRPAAEGEHITSGAELIKHVKAAYPRLTVRAMSEVDDK